MQENKFQSVFRLAVMRHPVAFLNGVLLQQNNGMDGDRTHDSQIKSLLLYQLSYHPERVTLLGIAPRFLAVFMSRATRHSSKDGLH